MTLALPDTKAVLDLLSMFIGERPPLADGPGIDLAVPPRGTYITWLKGAGGAIEGAIVSDLAASLYLGGELIMMPAPTLMGMKTQGKASDAVLDGLGEVFNNLRGMLNRIEMNPHVTPSEPELYTAPQAGSDAAWILNPSRRVDLRGETPFGVATLGLLSR